jgi:hypothetical protein
VVTVAPADFNTVSPVDLIRRIAQGQGEFLLFALTPDVSRPIANARRRSPTRQPLGFARSVWTA